MSSRRLAIGLGLELSVAAVDCDASVTLTKGSAHILGVPLTLRDANVIEVGSGAAVVGTSPDTEVEISWTSRSASAVVTSIDVNDTTPDEVHAILQDARATAQGRRDATRSTAPPSSAVGQSQASQIMGPVCFIVGEADKGKSTLCKGLVNRLVTSAPRSGAGDTFRPGVAFVDIDIGQSAFMPGAIATAFVEDALPLEGGGFAQCVPLTFFYGDKSVAPRTVDRYLDLVALTQAACAETAASSPKFRYGGVIVNTMGWVTGLGLDILRQAVDIMRATHIVAVEASPELAETLTQWSRVSSVRGLCVVHARRNGRIRPRSTTARTVSRSLTVARFFTGVRTLPFQPARLLVNLADIVLLDAVSCEPLPALALKPLMLVAVSHALDVSGTAFANVAGFVVILEIGYTSLVLLAPCSGPLPSRFLLVSSNVKLSQDNVPPLTAP